MAQRSHKSGKFIKKSGEVFDKAFGKAGNFAERHKIQLAERGFWGTVGLGLEVASIIGGTSRRIKEGERFGTALAKELLINIPWGIAPGAMFAYTLGSAVVEVAPIVKQGAEQSAYYNNNFNFLGGGYIDTQINYINRARAVDMIKRNRAGIRNALGSEARRFHQTY